MSTIATAAARLLYDGVNDNSGATVRHERPKFSDHSPKVYIMSAKGPREEFAGGLGVLSTVFGAETFDPKSKFFNTATLQLPIFGKAGNDVTVQRLVPDDAGTPANKRIYVDLLPTTIKVYKRYNNGTIQRDGNGDPIQDGTDTIEGFKVKLITEYTNGDITVANPKEGTMTDSDGNKSQMYPIMTIPAYEVGSDYNKNGIGMEALKHEQLDLDFIKETRKLPYRLSVYRNAGTSRIVKTLTDALYTKVTLEDAFHPVSQENWSIEDKLIPSFYNTKEGSGFRFPDFGQPVVHQDNLVQVQDLIIAKEAPVLDRVVTTVEGDSKIVADWMDFIEVTEADVIAKDKGLLDVINFKSTKNVPYFTVEFDKTPVTTGKEVRLSANTPVYLEGGQDGTVDWATYQQLFKAEMEDYLNPYSRKQSLALNQDTIIYDPGLDLDVKLATIGYTALRKNTVVVMSTWEANKPNATWEEQLPIAKALMARMALTPESSEWNTPFARGFIVLGHGKPVGVNFKGYVPNSYDVALKFAKYFGNKNGWQGKKDFVNKGANIIKEVEVIEPKFIPEPLYDKLYKDGIIWPYNSDRTDYLFPTFRSTYSDMTSVLTNPRVIFGVLHLVRIAYESWLYFAGSDDPKDIFKVDVENWIKARITDGYFDNKVSTGVKIEFTDTDNELGFSWTIHYKLFGNSQLTVASGIIDVERMVNK